MCVQVLLVDLAASVFSIFILILQSFCCKDVNLKLPKEQLFLNPPLVGVIFFYN